MDTREGAPDDAGERLVEEARRLLRSAAASDVPVRVMGGIAVRLRCPGQAEVLSRFGRRYEDVDVVAYGKHAKPLRKTLSELGYAADEEIFVNSGGSRMVVALPAEKTHLDVFLDDLRFCHTIPMKGRLELDEVTLPLADLLLQKLQIVRINVKDIVDVIALVLEHPLGRGDRAAIDVERIATLTADDWGLWRTVTLNLDRVREFCDEADLLTAEERRRVAEQLDGLAARIAAEPRGLRWKMRAKVGDRVKWYQDVEDLREGEGVDPLAVEFHESAVGEAGHGPA